MTFDGNNSHNSTGVQKQNPSLVNICSEGSKQQAADPISPETLHLLLHLPPALAPAPPSPWLLIDEVKRRRRREEGVNTEWKMTPIPLVAMWALPIYVALAHFAHCG